MAQKIRATVTLQLPAGGATPAPPVGTALGPHGINIVEFTKSYNEKTADRKGEVIPAVITIFEDRSFTFVTKTPPTPVLLRKAAGLEKGSANPRKDKIGYVGASYQLTPALALTGDEANRLRSGQAVPLFRKSDLDRLSDLEDGDIVLAKTAGTAVAIARLEQGMLAPVRVLHL